VVLVIEVRLVTLKRRKSRRTGELSTTIWLEVPKFVDAAVLST
jgi:hypothetical protein